jgi:uncharacterized membrane protein YeaQ/YmgE (transglycosylase-associated protein family)
MSIFRVCAEHRRCEQLDLIELAKFADHANGPCASPTPTRRHVMHLEAVLVLLLIGAVAGFLAGVIVKGYGYGLVGNIVVGIVGAIIAGAVLPRLGVFPNTDIIGQIVAATIGAVGLLVVIGVVRRIA